MLNWVFLVTQDFVVVFFSVEGNLPLLFPLLEPIKILLEFDATCCVTVRDPLTAKQYHSLEI